MAYVLPAVLLHSHRRFSRCRSTNDLQHQLIYYWFELGSCCCYHSWHAILQEDVYWCIALECHQVRTLEQQYVKNKLELKCFNQECWTFLCRIWYYEVSHITVRLFIVRKKLTIVRSDNSWWWWWSYMFLHSTLNSTLVFVGGRAISWSLLWDFHYMYSPVWYEAKWSK